MTISGYIMKKQSALFQKARQKRRHFMLYKNFDADREYLINKFRNPVFDSDGMTNEEIIESVQK